MNTNVYHSEKIVKSSITTGFSHLSTITPECDFSGKRHVATIPLLEPLVQWMNIWSIPLTLLHYMEDKRFDYGSYLPLAHGIKERVKEHIANKFTN